MRTSNGMGRVGTHGHLGTTSAVTALLLSTAVACGATGREPGAQVAASDAGPGAPSAAPAAGGAPAAGSTPEPTASGTPSTAPDPCAALTVLPGPSVVTEVAWPARCDGAISSPSGDVGLGTHSALEAPAVTGFALYSADGTRLGVAAPTGAPTPIADPFFHPAASGYQGIALTGLGTACAAWDRTGAGPATIDCGGHPVASAPTGAGGTVYLVDPSGGGSQRLVRAGADGRVLASTAIDGAATLVLESWSTSHVVAVDLSSGSGPRARWFGAGGVALTPWFPTAGRTPAYGSSLKLLVDGSVAVYDGVAWTVVLRDGVAGGEAPPAWLARLSSARLATIRQGRGYAVLRDDLAGSASFDVVTPDGVRCGTVTLPGSDAQRLDCGYDGTVIALEPRPPSGTGPGDCAFRWWPGLLR